MRLSFNSLDVIILDPDTNLERVIDEAYERYYTGYWTTRSISWFYNFIAKKGYSVLLQSKEGDIFIPSSLKKDKLND